MRETNDKTLKIPVFRRPPAVMLAVAPAIRHGPCAARQDREGACFPGRGGVAFSRNPEMDPDCLREWIMTGR